MNEAYKTQSSTCRSCGKPIVWMKTKAGKNMPCDEELVLFWRDEGGQGHRDQPRGRGDPLFAQGRQRTTQRPGPRAALGHLRQPGPVQDGREP